MILTLIFLCSLRGQSLKSRASLMKFIVALSHLSSKDGVNILKMIMVSSRCEVIARDNDGGIWHGDECHMRQLQII